MCVLVLCVIPCLEFFFKADSRCVATISFQKWLQRLVPSLCFFMICFVVSNWLWLISIKSHCGLAFYFYFFLNHSSLYAFSEYNKDNSVILSLYWVFICVCIYFLNSLDRLKQIIIRRRYKKTPYWQVLYMHQNG